MAAVSVRRWMALIVGVAIGLRVALGVVHPFWFPDSSDYDGLARSMLERGVYEVGGNVATRMPGYPVFLAGVYGLGGGVGGVMVLQALMGGIIVSITASIIFWIVRWEDESNLNRRRIIGAIAAALVAVDPLSVAFSASLLSEVPFTLMLMAGMWIAVHMENRKVGLWVALGIVWGIAVYLRPSVLLCLLPVAAIVAVGEAWAGGWRKFVGLAVAIAIVYAMAIPWQVRNHLKLPGSLYPLTTLEGISLYEAVYAGADGGPKQDVIPLPAAMAGMNEGERDREWSRMAWEEIREHPGRIMWLAVRKVARTWTPFLNAGEFQNPLIQIMMGLWHIPLYLLALMGVFWGNVERKMKWLLLTPVLYFTAVHALFLGSVRYRVPLMPIVCIFAVLGIVAIWRRIGKPRDEAAV